MLLVGRFRAPFQFSAGGRTYVRTRKQEQADERRSNLGRNKLKLRTTLTGGKREGMLMIMVMVMLMVMAMAMAMAILIAMTVKIGMGDGGDGNRNGDCRRF